MGAFSLANLLQGAENRKLYSEEVGPNFGILQCTSWGRDDMTRKLAKKAMHYVYLDGVDPPSLKEMCLYKISDTYEYFAKDFLQLPKSLKSMICPFQHFD
eukprot:m.100107 g.100107  ORF g.100107 m.100107 type:complete len:100 (+) comp37084_c0_seq4:1446-1745(+)